MKKALGAILTVLILILLFVLLSTYRRPNDRVEAGEIHIEPSERLSVGQEAALTIPVSGSGELAFQWSADRGTLSTPLGPSTNYKAPSTPGRAIVNVQITSEGNSVVKSKVFDIIDQSDPADSSTSILPVGAVTLASHKEGQTVPCEAIAKGRYSSDVTGAIWPVVYVGNAYHPQDEGGKGASKVNGDWTGTVRFGDCDKPQEASGKTFQLLVVTADDTANRAFESYLQSGRQSGFPGMRGLPAGTVEHVRILVMRD